MTKPKEKRSVDQILEAVALQLEQQGRMHVAIQKDLNSLIRTARQFVRSGQVIIAEQEIRLRDLEDARERTPIGRRKKEEKEPDGNQPE